MTGDHASHRHPAAGPDGGSHRQGKVPHAVARGGRSVRCFLDSIQVTCAVFVPAFPLPLMASGIGHRWVGQFSRDTAYANPERHVFRITIDQRDLLTGL